MENRFGPKISSSNAVSNEFNFEILRPPTTEIVAGGKTERSRRPHFDLGIVVLETERQRVGALTIARCETLWPAARDSALFGGRREPPL
ncbi:hypothetical protein EVAR_90077_1 [Eumeta japonica]|uniref:Uncharacterized protein n=1 Tax=Eumeta variegata TaxID=151549 RepID=A0A4C1WXX0_EUMVA|nr:hypothetical protein EVAR_90077_1 [Eumeta japonica]